MTREIGTREADLSVLSSYVVGRGVEGEGGDTGGVEHAAHVARLFCSGAFAVSHSEDYITDGSSAGLCEEDR